MGGFGVILSLDLAVGDTVTYVCPFARDGQNIEQQAECRWSAPASPGGTQRIYGFRRARARRSPTITVVPQGRPPGLRFPGWSSPHDSLRSVAVAQLVSSP